MYVVHKMEKTILFAAALGVEPDAQQSFVNYNFEHDSIFFAPPRLQTTLMDDSFLEIGTWYGRASSQKQILPMGGIFWVFHPSNTMCRIILKNRYA